MTSVPSRIGWSRWRRSLRPRTSHFVMVAILGVMGFYLLYPIVVILAMSFNTAVDVVVDPPEWGLDNWTSAWDHPLLFQSIRNSFLLWFLISTISMPFGIGIALLLSRTRIPFTYGLEYMFWIVVMFPDLAATLGWMLLLDPDVGFLNLLVEKLPFVDRGPFNVFSLPGIVWVKIMGDGIATKVMLLTPAFRNMDSALEEAARVSGASSLKTMVRVTLPVMVAPITLVLALQLMKVFSGFETEQLLGARWGFYVYSTLIYREMSIGDIPRYGPATVLASITFLILVFIIPMQRWIVHRRFYTTVSGAFRPGLIDLGRWRFVALGGILGLIFVLTVVPFFVILIGSFMARVGFFNTTPLWTLQHWQFVLGDQTFLRALRTTLILSVVAGILSPILFSVLAYVLVRTRLRGRWALDSMIWAAGAVPGVLAGLGLLLMFLSTPGLTWLHGSIWALIIVVVISGITKGVNLFKGVLVQIGSDLEEAARISGAGWVRTYFRVVVPVLMPTMVLIGMLNFVSAAGTTGSIILVASRGTETLSLLTLRLASAETDYREAAGIVSLVVMAMTLGVVMVGRYYGLRMGVRHDERARQDAQSRISDTVTTR